MSKSPKIDHEYHAGKDKLKITIRGYNLKKRARDEILKKLIREVERHPDRLIAAANKSERGVRKKNVRGPKRNLS